MDARRGHHRGVLVIDQFEELFVSTPAGLRADFVAQLVDLLDSPLPITVVLMMRNDFYGRLDDSAPALLRWVEQGLVNVPPLDRGELAEIVAKPAKKVGLGFEEGLVEVILEGATAMRAEGGSSAALLALGRIRPHRAVGTEPSAGGTTHQAYRDLDGISGALNKWAYGAYQGLDGQKRPIARSIFLDLVHVADEEGVPDTRKRKDLSSLCPAIEDRGRVEEVVNTLAKKRLVITGERQATVELIHDALIREWDPLRGWISEERPFRRWLQEMEPALRAWTGYVGRNRKGEEPDWLRGQRLVQAERWLESHETDLSRDLKELIKDSMRVRDEDAERERQAEALLLAAHSEQAMRTAHPAPVIALALAVESVLTEPTVQGDIAIRRVLRLHPRTLARFRPRPPGDLGGVQPGRHPNSHRQHRQPRPSL